MLEFWVWEWLTDHLVEQRYYIWSEAKAEDLLRREVAQGHPSVADTWCHIDHSDKVWLLEIQCDLSIKKKKNHLSETITYLIR